MNPVFIAIGEHDWDQHIIDRIISFTSCPLSDDIKNIIAIFKCRQKIEDRGLLTTHSKRGHEIPKE